MLSLHILEATEESVLSETRQAPSGVDPLCLVDHVLAIDKIEGKMRCQLKSEKKHRQSQSAARDKIYTLLNQSGHSYTYTHTLINTYP